MVNRIRARSQAANTIEGQLRHSLSEGTRSAEALQQVLGVSQPTLSRTIQEASRFVLKIRLAGQRTPVYGLVRALARAGSQQPLYAVDESGAVHAVGTVALLAGGQSLVVSNTQRRQLFDGLPPAMTFAGPSGFLGRQVAIQAARRIGVPASLADWSDDDKATYLFTLETDAPGNLVFGDAPLAELLEQRKARPVVQPRDKAKAYVRCTEESLHAVVGSSAGGHQPKFTCETTDLGHVIVKFAKQGSRMADLLVLEHLALSSLAAEGMPAANTQILQAGGMMLLESQRFDRVGRFGRKGVISAGSFDDEHFGHRDSWSAFADRCVQAHLLAQTQADIIRTFAAFSELIGNTDTHFENLSLMVDAGGRPLATAPAYDLLPMKYASEGAGMDPSLTPLSPKLGAIGVRPGVWNVAFAAARTFWEGAARDARLSKPMRALATKNLAIVTDFVQPLVPVAAAVAAPARNRSRPRSGR